MDRKFSVVTVKDGVVGYRHYDTLGQAEAFIAGRYDEGVEYLRLSPTVIAVTGKSDKFMSEDVYIVEVSLRLVEMIGDKVREDTAAKLFDEVVKAWDKFEGYAA